MINISKPIHENFLYYEYGSILRNLMQYFFYNGVYYFETDIHPRVKILYFQNTFELISNLNYIKFQSGLLITYLLDDTEYVFRIYLSDNYSL